MKKSICQQVNKSTPLLRFRRWSRAKYAIFCSLGRQVSIGRLSVDVCNASLLKQPARTISTGLSGVVLSALFSLSVVDDAAAQPDTLLTVPLSEVEVFAQRQQQLGADLSRIVHVVSRAELQQAAVHSLPDLLRFIAGIDIRQRGGDGVQTDLSIRGGTFDQALVLINGINVTDPQTGHHSLNIPIDFSSIERIEFLHSPATRVLGLNAFSGAINIVTRQAERTEAAVRCGTGSFGYLFAGGDAVFRRKKLSAFLSLSKKHSDGYIDNTDYNIANAFTHIAYDVSPHCKLRYQLGYQDKRFGAYAFYSALYPNQYEATQALFSSFSADYSISKWKIAPALSFRQHNDRFELFRDFADAPEWYTFHNAHQTNTVGLSLPVSLTSRWGKSTLGFNMRSENIRSNSLGKHERIHFDLSFNHSAYFNAVSVSFGALANYTKQYGGNIYFGGDIAYQPFPALQLSISVNQSLRNPTFTDLYFSNAAQQGDPNLAPEKALTYELAAKFQQAKFSANFSAFYRQGRNIIDWVLFPEQTKYQSVNHASIDAWGGETTINYMSKEGFVRRVCLFYSYLDANKATDMYVSRYALDYLQHKTGVLFTHTILYGFSASWQAAYYRRTGNYAEAVSNQIKTYKPFFLCDFRLQWQYKQATISAELSNLLNINYIDYGGIPQAGRIFKVMFQISL